ncbi:MAG: polysaccharide biosynthesis tyrosine autokinase [Rubrivivax sp.]|nr:MAG: polysaccharide biosynthesis tyrosine autokinase [Rubrivivax sp.]
MNSSREHRVIEDASLGDILRRTKGLSADHVLQALDHQRQHNMRFGEAVVALGFARPADVVWALSQQFHYPYAPTAEQDLHEELVVANDPFSEEVEAFRDLRSQLLMSVLGEGSERHALAVVSPDVGDGKSFIVANLAVAFSQLPGRTLLVDADLRSARLHEVFNVDAGPGLTSILAGRAEANVIKPVAHLPNLYLLPAGVVAPNPVELLQQAAFSLLLRELHDQFDHIVVDTPAAALGSDARIIASHCGAALVIARKDRSRVPQLQKLVKQLGKASVKLGGVLMNEF